MAVAAGLVWATLLMCVALGAGQLQPPTIASLLFPGGSLPPPVRIYCKEQAWLNVAVSVDGNVVLAKGDCKDLSQKWLPVYNPISVNEPAELKPFSLQNMQTGQVITIPSASGEKVGLSSSPPTEPLEFQSWVDAAREQLWTPGQPRPDDGFYQLFVTKNPALTLNGLLGGVHVGTEVGIYSASPDSNNAIWQLTSYPPPCGP